MNTLAKNKRASFDYDIQETLVAGMVLTGAETKSAKSGNISMAGSYVSVSPSGASLVNCHIGPYRFAADEKYNPLRARQLLLNKHEIDSLLGKAKGLLIVPLEIFLGRRGLVKISIGIGRARKKTDKREVIKKRETEKEMRREAR